MAPSNFCPAWNSFLQCTTSNPLTPAVWQHVAVVFLANSQILFVNGTPVQTFTNSITGNDLSGDKFNIGYDYDLGSTGDRTYKGVMDELRLWSVDKSTDITTKSYRCSPLSGTPTGLVRYYKFDETSGTTASDSSGNGGNGTLKNGNAGTGNGPAWTASTIDTEPTSPCYVPPPPVAPTNLTATSTSTTQINLSWTDNSSDETGFKIEQPAGTVITTTAAGIQNYSHTGLTCGTTYNYTVKATNANGDSTAITASATTATCPVVPPSTPVVPPSTPVITPSTPVVTPSTPPLPENLSLFLQIDGTGPGKVTTDTGLSCHSTDCQVNPAGELKCNPQASLSRHKRTRTLCLVAGEVMKIALMGRCL